MSECSKLLKLCSMLFTVLRVNVRDLLAEPGSEVADGWLKLSADSCERLNFAPNQVWNQRLDPFRTAGSVTCELGCVDI